MHSWLQPTILEGKRVKLIPLQKSHKANLLKAASDGKLWELWFTSVPSEHNIDSYIEAALQAQENGTALPFVVVEKNSGEVIGSTRYLNVEEQHRRLEIGATWYAKRTQRTGLNLECKHLLLGHAFEELKCIAVEFRTHYHNIASRTAIAKLGAKQEGILRNHRIDPNGNYRDTVVFSILESEWPTVKHSLEHRMNRTY
nr:GNAT family protein [Allomuricauda sp.]